MAGQRKKPEDTGVVHRLAGRGEDALTKIVDELGKNSRVTDALGRAVTAKDKVDERTRKTLASLGVAAADEIKDLRRQLERLEKRLAQLEGGKASSGSTSPARRSKSSSSAKKKTSGSAKSSTTAKKSGATSGSSFSGGSSSGSSASSGSTTSSGSGSTSIGDSS